MGIGLAGGCLFRLFFVVMREPSDRDIADAVRTLARAGAVFSLPRSVGSLSLRNAAARLDVEVGWMRRHLHEFHGVWRLPAGSSGIGQAVGELRVPIASIERFEASRSLGVAAEKGAQTVEVSKEKAPKGDPDAGLVSGQVDLESTGDSRNMLSVSAL